MAYRDSDASGESSANDTGSDSSDDSGSALAREIARIARQAGGEDPGHQALSRSDRRRPEGSQGLLSKRCSRSTASASRVVVPACCCYALLRLRPPSPSRSHSLAVNTLAVLTHVCKRSSTSVCFAESVTRVHGRSALSAVCRQHAVFGPQNQPRGQRFGGKTMPNVSTGRDPRRSAAFCSASLPSGLGFCTRMPPLPKTPQEGRSRCWYSAAKWTRGS